MHALATNRDDGKGRGRTGLRPFGGMGSCRTPIDHHQSSPARRDLRARHSGRGFGLGRFFATTGDVLEFEALRRAGLSSHVALANLSQAAAHFAVQANPELLPIVHVPASKVARLDSPEAIVKDFAGEQIDRAYGAKSD